MVSKNTLLQNLPPFLNNQEVIMENQNVVDIINGILNTHEQYKSQYDNISTFFLGKNLEDTAYNVWNFLKKNVPYRIEPENLQTLRSPSSIISGLPADCKTFSLFSNGILDSLRRKGLINCKLAFRFAGYGILSDNLEHVFSVINPKTKNEIWCDPVLPNFDEKKEPTIFKDKIINMALVALSGIENVSLNLKGLTSNSSGKFDVNKLVSTASSLTNPISAGLKAIEVLTQLFQNAPNPNDWQGWDRQDYSAGRTQASTVRGYIIGDGDSVQNEALNIISYIKTYGIDVLINGNPARTTGDTRLAQDGKSWRNVTIDEIINKLSRGGYSQEANQIKQTYDNAVYSGLIKDTPPDAAKTAGMNILVTLGLAGAAIYAISKMSK